MKKSFYPVLIITALFLSCNSNGDLPNTDIEVARAFITDIQQNNFKQAEKLLLKEEKNVQYFESFEQYFKKRPKEELEKYKNADIIINEYKNLSDSVSIVNYSNSFIKTEKNDLKIVKINGQWLVDLKYTFPKKD